MKSRDVTLIGIWAALYAILVYVFAPISFQALQFRVADILPPSIAKKKLLAVAYAIGVVAGNIISPYAGPWDLGFMPFMSFVAGLLGYYAAKLYSKLDYYICGVVESIVIALSVSFMLEQLLTVPMFITFPMLLVSELILSIIGAVIFKLIERRWVWWS